MMAWPFSRQPKSDPNADLRQQLERLQLQREIDSLSEPARSDEPYGGIVRKPVYSVDEALEQWGAAIDELYAEDRYRQQQGQLVPHVDKAHDYKDGDCPPFYIDEHGLARLRGESREIAAFSTLAINILQLLKSYVVGAKGFTYSANAKQEGDEAAAEDAQAVVDEFLRRNHWRGTRQLNNLESRRVQGERFNELEWLDGGFTRVKDIPAAWVTEPTAAALVEEFEGLPALHWKYGVATDPEDMETAVGFFVLPGGDIRRWRFVPAERMVHAKSNTRTINKRGRPDFVASAQWAKLAEKLGRNSLTSGAIVAAIALIRKHAGTTRAGDIGRGGSEVTYRGLPAADRQRLRFEEQFETGTVLDTKNVDYEVPAMASGVHAGFNEASEMGDRRFAIGHSTPYNMASGDPSNNAYASSLAAEAPFTKYAEQLQSEEVTADEEMLWKAIGWAAQNGRIRGCSTLEQVQEKVDLVITPPEVSVHDRDLDHRIRKEENAAGVRSIETWRDDVGLDHETEEKRFEEEAKRKAARNPITQPVGPDGQPLPPGQKAAEVAAPHAEEAPEADAEEQRRIEVRESILAELRERDALEVAR